MSIGRYYFPDIKGNEDLSSVAQLSKQALREGEKIIEIFRKNFNILYRKSPGKVSLLVEQNRQSIFDLSPNNSISSKRQKDTCGIRKSSEDLSTPVIRNIALSRRCLSDGDTMKDSESTVLESEAVLSQNIGLGTKRTCITVKKVIDDTDIVDEVFVTPSPPKCSKSTGNLDTENQKHPCFNSIIDDIGACDEKFSSSNASQTGGTQDSENQESPRSAQTTKMFASLNVDDCSSEIYPKENIVTELFPSCGDNPDNIPTTKQDLEEFFEEGLTIPKLTTDEKHTPGPVKRAKISSNQVSKSQIQGFAKPDEKVEIAVNQDEDNKITDVSFSDSKVIASPILKGKIIEISEEKRKSPSPRRNKLFLKEMPRIICSDGSDELDIELPCESEDTLSRATYSISPKNFRLSKKAENITDENTCVKDRIGCTDFIELPVERSPKTLQRKFSPSGNKNNVFSTKNAAEMTSPTLDRVLIPRNRISPTTRNSKPISPNVPQHPISPLERKTSCSPNIFFKPNSPETSVDYTRKSRLSSISPKISECQISPSDKKSCMNTAKNLEEINNTCKTKGFLEGQSSSISYLKTKTSLEYPCDNLTLKQIDNSDSNVLGWFTNKLNKLISQRDGCMNDIFESFSEFQKELNFVFLYVKRIAYVVEKIPTDGQEYTTEEFQKVIADLKALYRKVVDKFYLWKMAGDSEIQTWIQCFEEIRIAKSRKEARNNANASPVEYMRFLRGYEKDLKSVWKKMDDMKIQEDSRRSSILNITSDFETLIKLFVKSLIIIGVLKLRPKISK